MLEVARRVAANRPKFQWLFLGITPPSVEWARSNFHTDFLDHHFVFRGHVPHLEALDRVRASRIGFTYHPLERRFLVAIPMKVFEHLLLEVPVVSTALPELTRLLRADATPFSSTVMTRSPTRSGSRRCWPTQSAPRPSGEPAGRGLSTA